MTLTFSVSTFCLFSAILLGAVCTPVSAAACSQLYNGTTCAKYMAGVGVGATFAQMIAADSLITTGTQQLTVVGAQTACTDAYTKFKCVSQLQPCPPQSGVNNGVMPCSQLCESYTIACTANERQAVSDEFINCGIYPNFCDSCVKDVTSVASWEIGSAKCAGASSLGKSAIVIAVFAIVSATVF